MPIDRILSWCTRKIGFLPGLTWLVNAPLRMCVKHYRGREDRWVVLQDFDGDLKMRVDRAGNVGGLIYWYGFNSSHEIFALGRLLKRDSVFVDIGANHGEFTLYAAKRVPAGRVVAFEPVPGTFKHLQENVALNGFTNVTLCQAALGDHQGEVSIFAPLDPGFDCNSSLFLPADRPAQATTVPLDTLDAAVRRLGIGKVDVMKIDVEGAEVTMLRGARETLRAFRPTLIVELSESSLNAAGTSGRELADLLGELGYQLFQVGRFGVRRPLDPRNLPAFCNLYCVPIT